VVNIKINFFAQNKITKRKKQIEKCPHARFYKGVYSLLPNFPIVINGLKQRALRRGVVRLERKIEKKKKAPEHWSRSSRLGALRW